MESDAKLSSCKIKLCFVESGTYRPLPRPAVRRRSEVPERIQEPHTRLRLGRNAIPSAYSAAPRR